MSNIGIATNEYAAINSSLPLYRLLALDMDGTLLNAKKIITPQVHEALESYIRKGGRATIASGRFPASVWLHARAAKLNTPCVALNGAIILDETTGELMQGVALSQKSLLKLIHFTEQLGAYIQLYGYNKLYVPELNERNSAWPMANVVVSPNKELTEENYADQTRHIEVIPVGDLSTFISSIQCIELPVYKATVISDNPELIDELLFMLEGIHEYTLTKTGRHRFDVNALGVSKRSALQQLCRQLQITHNEVAAVGDYDNDAEMLSWAGLGVAMGNAEPHVKEIADVITASNENDGVAQAIMNHLL